MLVVSYCDQALHHVQAELKKVGKEAVPQPSMDTLTGLVHEQAPKKK